MTKTIIATGDWHVGCDFAICPPSFETSLLGQTHRPNKGQEYLLECYEHFLNSIPKRFDVLLINGDAIQGTREARTVWEPDPLFQARAAAELLRPLAKRAKHIYVTRGTTWHSGEGGEAEEKVGEMLGAEKWGSHYCFPFLRLNLDGVRIDVAHHLSHMLRYRSSALEREIQFATLLHEWDGEPDLIIRSHIHHWYYVNAEGKVAFTIPGWQLQNIYVATSTLPTRKFPKWLGGVKVIIYPEKKCEAPQNVGEFARVTPFLYQHPGLISEVIP